MTDGTFRVALATYLSADAPGALGLLAGSSRIDATLLRGRIQHRLDAWSAAIEEFRSLDDVGLVDDQIAHAKFLQAASLTQLRELEKSRSLLDESRILAYSSNDRALEAEFHYYDLSWHFASGAYDAAELAAENALHCELIYGSAFESAHLVPLGITKARAHSALGIIAGAREDYFQQARHFREAVTTFESTQQVDDWTYATILMNLSYTARDLDITEDAERVRRALDRPWSPALDYNVFEMRRSVAWHLALSGRLAEAIETFECALHEARSLGLAVLVRAELINIKRELVLSDSTRSEILATASLARSVDWENIGEERNGLAALARELAPLDVKTARDFINRYKRLRTPIAPRHLDSRDRRVVAFERLAEGAVLRYENRWPEAIRAFLDAFEIWHEVGMRWRASLAALEIAELERSQYFIDYARTEADRRTGSLLAERAMHL